MINSWTNENIEAIMIQLNNHGLPFKKCEFSALGEGMTLLGSGASSNVYEAIAIGKNKKEYAIKVIGFGNKHVDSKAFCHSVEAQRSLGYAEHNIVKIYDWIELRVWIEGEHEVIKTEKINSYEESKPEGDYIHLQFILMEKISPVLMSYGLNHKLIPHRLERYDEKEIMKLAYEIGIAIEQAHNNNIIHRDIKLENIFYDTKGNRYKLGDFGIARITKDGMASTVAFTKGYGAPEVVGTIDDKYDFTADIYSFGMMLYVLLNEMRFPGSTDYHPTIYQYYQGYVPPEPINGSNEFVKIVLKMISFAPDDRFQSMEEVLNELDKLKYGHRVKYQREHKNIALVLGTVFALIGAAGWKLTFMEEMKLDFSIWTYLFCVLCIAKSILTVFEKKTAIVSAAIFGMGIHLMIITGFTLWKIILLIFMVVVSDYWTGLLGGCAIISNVTYLILKAKSLSVKALFEYRWVAVLLLSLSFILLILHFLLRERDDKVIKLYFGKNIFWIVVIAYFITLVLLDWSFTTMHLELINLYERIIGEQTVKWIMSWNPQYVGIFGVSFCIIWIIRELILVYIEKLEIGEC